VGLDDIADTEGVDVVFEAVDEGSGCFFTADFA